MTDKISDKKPKVDVFTATESKCTSDVKGPLPCSLLKDDIQLIPMRYAISEEAEQIKPSWNNSLYKDEESFLGIRPLEPGYIYCIHSAEPETLVQFSISDFSKLKGSKLEKGQESFSETGEDAMIFPRRGILKSLYMPKALTPERANILLASKSDQDELMNSLNLSSLNVLEGNPGFVPTQHLPDTIDFSANVCRPKAEIEFGSYQWLEKLSWCSHAQSPINASIKLEYKKDSGILLLNDICSDIKEAGEKRNYILERYYSYCTKLEGGYSRQDRYEMALLLKQLMNAEVFVKQAIESLQKEIAITFSSAAQEEEFSKLVSAYFYALEDQNNYVREKRILYNGDIRYIRVNTKSLSIESRFEQEFNVKTRDAKKAVLSSLIEYRALLEGKGGGHTTGMKDVINNEEIDDFLEAWETHKQAFAQHAISLNPLMKKISSKWHLLAAYISPKKLENYEFKLDCEDVIVTFFSNNDDEWLISYYLSNEEFPLSIYSDIDTKDYDITVKDAATIRSKFITLGDKLKASSSWEDKINKANSTKLLYEVKDQDLKIRVMKSLALKQNQFVVALSNALTEPGHRQNYSQRLESAFNNMPKGTLRLFQLNLEASNLKWNIPDEKAASTLSALCDKFEKLAAELKQQQNITKSIKSQNDVIKKMRFSNRKQARKKYNADLENSKQAASEIKSSLQVTHQEILRNTTAGSTMIGGSIMSAADIANEAEKLLKGRAAPGAMIDELFKKEGQLDKSKVQRHFLSSVLTTAYLFNAWHAWKGYLNEEQDADLLAAITSTMYATSGTISLAGTFYTAYLNATLAVVVEGNQSTLVRLAKWSVYSTATAGILGSIAMGIRTYKSVEDVYQANGDPWGQQALSITRAIIGTGGFAVSTVETFKYAQIARHLLVNSNSALASNTSLLTTSSRFIRWNIYLWVAFYAIDKVWHFYRWPRLVSWANSSLWGNNSKSWTLDQHYEELAPELVKPSMTHKVVGNSYTEDDVGEAEAQVSFLLPGIPIPSKDNVRLAITGTALGNTQSPPRSVDLLADLMLDVDVTAQANSSQITFYLRSDMLWQQHIALVKFEIEITSSHGETHAMYWDTRCSRLFFGPNETPNILAFNLLEEPGWISTTRDWLSIPDSWGKMPSLPLTPWSL